MRYIYIYISGMNVWFALPFDVCVCDGVLLNSINKIYQRTLGANTHASYVPVAVQSMVLLNELNKSATAL